MLTIVYAFGKPANAKAGAYFTVFQTVLVLPESTTKSVIKTMLENQGHRVYSVDKVWRIEGS